MIEKQNRPLYFMDKTFDLGIYSTEKTIFEGKVTSLIAPSVSGYLGILADHTPLAAKLSLGKIILRLSSGKIVELDSDVGGFLEVCQNQASILLK